MFKISTLIFACCALLTQGCRSLAPLPPADLQAPGWTVRQGAALWTPKKSAGALAGEIVAATNPDGQGLVYFTKNPFPIVMARRSAEGWEIRTAEGKRYARPGQPPENVLWFQLTRVLSGKPPSRGWAWEELEPGRWRLGGKRKPSLEILFSE